MDQGDLGVLHVGNLTTFADLPAGHYEDAVVVGAAMFERGEEGA